MRHKDSLMKLLTSNLSLLVGLTLLTGCATSSPPRWSAKVTPYAIVSTEGIVLKEGDRLSTPHSFKPPVEITLVAQTDSTNLRIAFAADQVIFNWELDQEQLRVDGGPADGLHKAGAGSIPAGKFVTIRWIVTPKQQTLYVDDELRFADEGDYSKIDRPVSVFPGAGSKVTVKSIRVKQLKDASE
jgi:hypothetical protein